MFSTKFIFITLTLLITFTFLSNFIYKILKNKINQLEKNNTILQKDLFFRTLIPGILTIILPTISILGISSFNLKNLNIHSIIMYAVVFGPLSIAFLWNYMYLKSKSS